MEVALRRRLEGVAEVRISQTRQTAEVRFAQGPHAFAASEFRAAVGEAGVEVLRFEVEACGRVEHVGDAIWFAAGPNRFAVAQALAFAGAGEVCLSAVLDDRESPGRLEQVRRETSGARRHLPSRVY
jgi:hypothetical protein